MRIIRLAQLFEYKYGFKSEAADVPENRILAETKRDILDSYRNYFSRSVRDSMFQYAADLGEPYSVELTHKMDKLIKDMNNLSPTKLIKSLNEIIKTLYSMKTDPNNSVRNAIHDSISGGSETQRNTRQRLLTKYERSLSSAFSSLQKAAVKLQVLSPDVPVHGGSISRQRGELSKQQLMDFILNSSSFKSYGLDSLDIMEEMLSDPDMKKTLTTLINAVNRGHIPLDADQIRTTALQIKERLKEKEKANIPALPPVGKE